MLSVGVSTVLQVYNPYTTTPDLLNLAMPNSPILPITDFSPQNTEGTRTYIAAPNIIQDDCCNHCQEEVNPDNRVQCYDCKNYFHAVGCTDDSYCVSAPSSFTSHLGPAVSNTKSYEKRFGRFLFFCNHCITVKEEMAELSIGGAANVYVDRKIEELKQNFAEELSGVKEMLKEILPSKQINALAKPPLTPCNPWDDSQRTEKLRSMIVIKNDESGKPIDKSMLEESCIKSKISIVNTMKLKSNDTAIILNSRSEAETLREKLSKASPQHCTSTVATKLPRITVVGLERNYLKDEIKEMIVSQNHGIDLLINDPGTSIEDKKIDVVAVVPLKNDQNSFKAIVRVSNLVRSAIAKQGDKLYIGTQRVCKVYDSFFVLRCFNCQSFGHHSKSHQGHCKSEHVCGYCAGAHETRTCDRSATLCCANCKKAGKHGNELLHAAYDPVLCPIFKDLQEKVKKTTPFYQSHNTDRNHRAV